MPAKTFIVAKKANKQLTKLPLKVHIRIAHALRELKKNPISGAKLGGELADQYKLRVGDYRIVYKFDAKESRVDVLKIEHRQGVYI